MNKFEKSLISEWRRMELSFEGSTFVIAVSGGADSLSLALSLDALRRAGKLKNRFVIGHADHGLRGSESEKDADFVRNIAEKYEFELSVKKLEIDKKSGNLEQSARTARYDFLIDLAANLGASGILTAHTLNDQAETFLMNLIRGSGFEGLSGIRSLRVLESGRKHRSSKIPIIRPLLSWATRESTENYCRDANVSYRYDSMNEDLAFQRVRIRKVLIPLLKDFNPNIVERLASTAFIIQEEYEDIQKIIDEHVETESVVSNGQVRVRDFLEFSPAIRRNLLRRWFKHVRGSLRGISTVHLEAVDKLAVGGKSGKIAELPGGDSVIKEDGTLRYCGKKS